MRTGWNDRSGSSVAASPTHKLILWKAEDTGSGCYRWSVWDTSFGLAGKRYVASGTERTDAAAAQAAEDAANADLVR